MTSGGAVTTSNFSERTRSLLSLVNLHYAGVGVLALLNLYLLAHMAYAWQAASRRGADELAQQTVAMRTAELQAKPLQGIDGKLVAASAEADQFYARRLPFAYSQVAGELGALAKRQGARLTRVQYSQAAQMDGQAGALTEVRMDASLSGDYRPLVLFVNSLERDRMFFTIRAVALTGQQSGTVGLRLGLTTYLRPPVGVEGTEKSMVAPDQDVALDPEAGVQASGGRSAR